MKRPIPRSFKRVLLVSTPFDVAEDDVHRNGETTFRACLFCAPNMLSSQTTSTTVLKSCFKSAKHSPQIQHPEGIVPLKPAERGRFCHSPVSFFVACAAIRRRMAAMASSPKSFDGFGACPLFAFSFYVLIFAMFGAANLGPDLVLVLLHGFWGFTTKASSLDLT